MEDIVTNNKVSENYKKFWVYVKGKRQESAAVSPLKDTDGFLRSDSRAEILNHQFKSVFKEKYTTNIPIKGKRSFPDMPNITVSEAEV